MIDDIVVVMDSDYIQDACVNGVDIHGKYLIEHDSISLMMIIINYDDSSDDDDLALL